MTADFQEMLEKVNFVAPQASAMLIWLVCFSKVRLGTLFANFFSFSENGQQSSVQTLIPAGSRPVNNQFMAYVRSM